MKANIRLEHNLPFVQLKVWYKGQFLFLNKVLLDTGSASTILKLELVEQIGITAESGDIVGSIFGVGGSEYVFLKTIDKLEINELEINNFTVDIGVMEYGIEIDGIIGIDLLLRMKGRINLEEMTLEGKLEEGRGIA